ncbi:MAG: hypothetical protein CBD98_001050 [Flavobacteriaceae bacterium TMED238]|nr:MAG: hypothetical protein CBD98_001050 [Flavobacteriaceae bacterium TMED238]|tara:strand:+ start:668 stop:1057 length:390 start_codon:yes stop_codon:yes gene_type:complete
MKIKANISIGELVDKITILEIKSIKIENKEKLKNVQHELKILNRILKKLNITEDIYKTKNELYKINLEMWEIEDKIRIFEKENKFDSEFIELARNVYKTNDNRSRVKKKLNLLLSSDLIEEKEYVSFEI